jgi:hypothetical protein
MAGDPLAEPAQVGVAQAGDGDVGVELATLAIEAELVEQPRAAIVDEADGVGLGDAEPEDPSRAAQREHPGAAQLHGEGRGLELVERGGEPASVAAVDLAEEVQGQVELLGRLPARARDAASHDLDVEVDLVGQVDAEEQAGHGRLIALSGSSAVGIAPMHRRQLPLAFQCPRETTDMPVRAGGRERWCEGCERTVHDLSQRSEAEARALLRRRSAKVCVSYEVDGRGKVLFRRTKLDRLGVALASAALLATGCIGFISPELELDHPEYDEGSWVVTPSCEPAPAQPKFTPVVEAHFELDPEFDSDPVLDLPLDPGLRMGHRGEIARDHARVRELERASRARIERLLELERQAQLASDPIE